MHVTIRNTRLLISFSKQVEFGAITTALTIKKFEPIRRDYIDVTYWRVSGEMGNPPSISVRTGLLDHVLRVAAGHRFDVTISNEIPAPSGRNSMPHARPTYTLYEEQAEAVRQAVQSRCGLLALGMGGGKTPSMCDVIRAAGYPRTLIVAPLSVLVSQHRREVAKFLSLDPHKDIGIVGGQEGTTGFKPLTIATGQSLQRMVRSRRSHLGSSVLAHFEMLLVDEAHRGIDRSGEIIDAMPNVHWVFGLTGTPRKGKASRDWKEKLFDITAVFGPVLSRVTPLELVRLGRTAVPVIRFADYESFCPVDRFASYVDYTSYLKRDERRNRAIAEIAMAAVQNQYPTLIYVEHEDHVDELAKWLPRAEIVTGSRRNPGLLDRLQSGKVSLVIATSTWREGISASRIQHVMRVAPGKDSTNQDQESQRGNRLKGEGRDFYFVTEMLDRYTACDWARRHTRERMKTYSLNGWPVYSVEEGYRVHMFDQTVVNQYLDHVRYVLSTRSSGER